MPGRISKPDDSVKISDDRVSSIQLELEQLLALGDPSEEGDENGAKGLNDKRRKARKILYKHRTGNLKDTNDDTDSKKKSKNNRRERAIKSGSSRSSKDSDESRENEGLKRNSHRRGSKSPKLRRRKDLNISRNGSKSPKPKNSRKEIRKIKYNKASETETAEENDRETRSHYSKGSKDSKGSLISKRSGHRKQSRSKTTGVAKEDANRAKERSETTTGEHASKGTIPVQRATSKRKAMRRRSWSFDDFSNTSWSSSEGEEEIEVALNDKDKSGLNDEGCEGEMGLNDELEVALNNEGKAQTRRSTIKLEQRRRPLRSNMLRSSSTGRLYKNGLGSPLKRNSRRTSGPNAIDGDMILGDPSRKAPPSRSKSIDMTAASRLRIGGGGDRKAPPTRSQSNDFSEYLRNQGMSQKSNHKPNLDQNDVESKGEADKNNPFEVTYQSQNVSDNWDPFTSDEGADKDTKDPNERRGNLRPTRSGGLLQTSSKDTISRLRIGANVLATSVCSTNSSSSEAFDTSKIEREKQRDKQRRAEYKKSIAAAAIAGRRLSGTAHRTNYRQVRTVQSSFEESVKQLECALQRAR